MSPNIANHNLGIPAIALKLLWIFIAYLLFTSILGCSVAPTGKNTNDNLSALDYAQQFAVHKQAGDLKRMVESMLKARYRWFYEKECYQATEKGFRSPGVFMGAFIFSSVRDASPIESQPQVYAEVLASMLDWQVVPESKSTYHPGYSHRNAAYFSCDREAKELQKAYSETMKRQYNLMSNPEYQDVIGWIARYEKLSEAEKAAVEKEYLQTIQRKGELEGDHAAK
ncbi:MAG: hypothetical protein ACD_75C00331G0009 [uncultured bacterium]|nr:MAG: hypothetical protein ACD_75C00331G0009 [uncultured bacterium]